MRISKGDVDAYRDAIASVGDEAGDYVRDALADAGGSVSAIRDAAIAAIADAVGVQGDMAQALAAQLYDEVCAAEGIDTEPAAIFDDLIDATMTAEKVHYLSNKLMEGRDDDFAADCADLAGYYMRRMAGDNTIRNCAANNVRYARVPTGPETCDWCIMLASRGFVYHSRDNALAARHRGCDCIVCPGTESTVIDGYDPAAYYRQWKDSGFMPSGGGGTKSRMLRNDVANGFIANIDRAASIGQLQGLINEANGRIGDMTERQRKGIQSAINRARIRITGR